MSRLSFFAHNLIAHPIAGLLWIVGLTRAGDYVHRLGAPS